MADYIWLSDEYSVPADTLCLHEPIAPNRDFRCVRHKGHAGKHEHMWSPRRTAWSHREGTPYARRKDPQP